MNRSEVVNYLKEIENEFPVEKWIVEGVECWPYIRLCLFFGWYNNSQKRQKSKNMTKNKAGKLERIIRSILFWNKVSKSDVLFVGNSKQIETHKERKNNRFFFYPMEIFDLNGISYQKLYYDTPSNDLKIDSDSVIVYENLRAYRLLMDRLLLKKKSKIELDGLGDLVSKFCSSVLLDEQRKDFLLNSIKNNLYKILFKELPVLSRLIDRVKPKLIIQTTFYNPVGFCLNIIAHRCGIPIIDIQHGGQGNLHLAYSNYNNVPKLGFKILPKYFWCWDAGSTEGINKWIINNNYHKSLTLGNPWISFLLSRRKKKINSINERKVILLTLQINEIEPYLLKTIKDTIHLYEWRIRLHPTLIEKKHEIENLLLSSGLLDKVEIRRANNENLVKLLLESEVHLSRYSGAIVEASLLGVYSIILDEVGVKTYEELINAERARAVTSKDSAILKQLLAELMEKEPLKPNILDTEGMEKFLLSFFKPIL